LAKRNWRYGHWYKLERALRFMESGDFAKGKFDDAMRLLVAVQQQAIRDLSSGVHAGPPLAAATVARKGHTMPFYDSGAYLSNVTIEVRIRAKLHLQARVGPANVKEPRTGEPLQKVAGWLEHGNIKVPARKMWEPLFDRIQDMPEWQSLSNVSLRWR